MISGRRVEEIRAQLAAQSGSRDSLAESEALVLEAAARLESQAAELSELRAQLRRVETKHEAEVSSMQASWDEVLAERNAARAKVAAQALELSELREQFAEVVGELRGVRGELDAARSDLSQSVTTTQVHLLALERQGTELLTARERCAELEREVAELRELLEA